MNDADLEQAALEQQAGHESTLRRRGICTHGACKGNAPCVCSHCGQEFASFADLLEERADLIS